MEVYYTGRHHRRIHLFNNRYLSPYRHEDGILYGHPLLVGFPRCRHHLHRSCLPGCQRALLCHIGRSRCFMPLEHR